MYVVIGASGQVGQEFTKCMPPERLVLLTHDQVEVTDRASIDRALDGRRCDAIINLAAYHDVNGCEVDPARAFQTNAIGAWNVAQAARRLRCRVVYFSSDYVFGCEGARHEPYVEHDRLGPLNVYGASKAAGEHVVAAAQDDHLIVRTSSLFGAVTSRKGWTFPQMILRRAAAGEPLRVVDDQRMTPTYTLDLVVTVIALVEAGATGVVHVTNRETCTWYDLARETLSLAGAEWPVEPVSSSAFPSAARRPVYSGLASERLESFNVSPLRDWRSALRAYLIEMGVVAGSAT